MCIRDRDDTVQLLPTGMVYPIYRAERKEQFEQLLRACLLYTSASMKELDGGPLDLPEISRMKAVLQICDDNDLGRDSVKYAPLSMIETLQEAVYQQMQAEASQMATSSQLPEAQEQALDEYPMPDEQVSTPDMQEYGYSYDGMLPVTRERALELDAAGLTVYVPVSYTHLTDPGADGNVSGLPADHGQ